MSVDIDLRGLDSLREYFRTAPERAERAEKLAVRDASRFARSQSSKSIRSQVNFTVSYLNENGRLELAYSRGGSEATLTGRHRATSLANRIFNKSPIRFGRPKKGTRIKVRVAKGSTGAVIKNGFYVPLKNGNVGLAVRTPGGRPPSAGAKPIFGGAAHLLYGPSVGQVAFDVFPEVAPETADRLAGEYVRHFERMR